MNSILTDEEIARYHDDGYVIPQVRLPGELLRELKAAVDQIIEAHPDVRPEHLMNPHMIPWQDGPNPFLELARNPEILDMVEQVLGSDLILWITRILCKPARDGQEVPWHQDGQYWPIRPLGTCSVWIAIDPATPENGCMRFIPGSHRRERLYSHHITERENLVLNQELDAGEFDETVAVNVVLEPGQMSLHDVRMIHGSLANASSQRRAGLILRYMPATSHFDRSLRHLKKDNNAFSVLDQPLWLMRGVDRCGKNDFQHGHGQWSQQYMTG